MSLVGEPATSGTGSIWLPVHGISLGIWWEAQDMPRIANLLLRSTVLCAILLISAMADNQRIRQCGSYLFF